MHACFPIEMILPNFLPPLETLIDSGVVGKARVLQFLVLQILLVATMAGTRPSSQVEINDTIRCFDHHTISSVVFKQTSDGDFEAKRKLTCGMPVW